MYNKKALYTHRIRHGPKRYKCLYCEHKVFFPFEIVKHSKGRHNLPPKYKRLNGVPFRKFGMPDPNLVQNDDQEQMMDIGEENEPHQVRKSTTQNHSFIIFYRFGNEFYTFIFVH